MTLLVGASTSLMCSASGEPSPIVRWLRHDVEVAMDDDGHLQTDGGGLLVINNVTLEYDGWYECQASNGVGQAQHRAIFVDVLGTSTRSDQKIGSVYNNRSNNNINTCMAHNVSTEAESEPQVVVRWGGCGQ